MSGRDALCVASIGKALAEVIDRTDDLVVVHAGLWAFGHRVDAPIADLPRLILQQLHAVVGTRCTIAMPTYVMDYPRTRTFDVERSRPHTGALAEAMLKAGGARTLQPMYSYVVDGPMATDILALRPSLAWGDDSFMGFAYARNARFVSLGLPWRKSFAYYHLAEVRMAVPYRYPKRFPGSLLRAGVAVGPCEEVIAVRPQHKVPSWTYDQIATNLELAGLIRRSGESDLLLTSAKVGDALDAVCERIADDPYALVAEQDKDDLRTWVRKQRAAEIAAMAPEHQFAGAWRAERIRA